MNIDRKISENINSSVNVIIARFLAAVGAVVLLVTLLTITGIFETTMQQMYILLLAALPGAILGLLVLVLKRIRHYAKTKYVLCFLMCFQAFAVAMAAYSYAGTIVLLLPVLLSALYPKSKLNAVVAVSMLVLGLIVPPLALVAGLWDGGYYEFLYDLTNGRLMDTATLSNELLTLPEQIMCAVRYCSSQNILIIGGFAVIGRLIYRQTNKSFNSQRDVVRLSETDELTGLLNRNCFERRLSDIAYLEAHSTVCFYFDVNGLHEMNNQYGHRAGDTMLQYVGRQIQNVFGEDNTFRIGGDEYVAFSGAMEPEALAATQEALEKAFAEQDYHVAIGYAQGSPAATVNDLVLQAEKEMYQAKSAFYTQHDRRRQDS